MVVRDVRTRWNYTYEMIRRALMLRKAIDRWTLDRDEYCELMLTADDWKLLEAIAEVLEVRSSHTICPISP
ncbi:hypothetical protein FA13DRAFT_1642887 [Coprinellus micaceus]|uniref:Uncharacterized protein n=1 Tax=Coprinellus micaceus TaxID=71717 RepID=A0A4Y7SGV4_COPMI|nr:hypothetical protein FA13DRAFT_1643727 [Coprinellus micaceus]TEB21380.1 hypothetical protein FA13DRAFT_1642887 [Coprinellus micaceus]